MAFVILIRCLMENLRFAEEWHEAIRKVFEMSLIVKFLTLAIFCDMLVEMIHQRERKQADSSRRLTFY